MFIDSLHQAFSLITHANGELFRIVSRSLGLALTSTAISLVIGLPLGVLIAQARFRGRSVLITLTHTGMAVPTVVIGVVFYCLLTRSGPLSIFSLLYTKAAIVIGQIALGLPIVVSLTISAISNLDANLFKLLDIMGGSKLRRIWTLLHEARFALATAVVACFGRLISEVGVAMILGGNIKGFTRTMTTAIALEHDKGELAMALALGLILLMLAFGINLVFQYCQSRGRKQ
jgi:tungstate transport system permease protein